MSAATAKFREEDEMAGKVERKRARESEREEETWS